MDALLFACIMKPALRDADPFGIGAGLFAQVLASRMTR